jgi:hypothetical protein
MSAVINKSCDRCRREIPVAKERIVKIVVQDTATNGLLAVIDDVSWETRPVPEPISFALLGLALAGLGFTRRRKLH